MGYTHYWDQAKDFTDRQWKDIQRNAERLLLTEQAQTTVDADPNGDALVINDEVVRFNGKNYDNLSHETFLLEKKKGDVPEWYSEKEKKKGTVFNFCKTAQKPYDKYVTAMLILADNLAPGVLHITSDGWFHEWDEGFALANKVLPGVIMPDHIKIDPSLSARNKTQKMIDAMDIDFNSFTDKVEKWI